MAALPAVTSGRGHRLETVAKERRRKKRAGNNGQHADFSVFSPVLVLKPAKSLKVGRPVWKYILYVKSINYSPVAIKKKSGRGKNDFSSRFYYRRYVTAPQRHAAENFTTVDADTTSTFLPYTMATEVDRLVTAADGMLVLCSAHETFKRRRWKGKGEGEEGRDF